MPVPTVDPLPPSPLATDSDAAFDAKAFPFFAAWNTYRTQMIALGVFTEEQADAALAAAVAGGTLPSLAGKALQYLRVNAAANGVEFATTPQPPMQTQAVWNTGTNTDESTISAAKLDAKILNRLNASGAAPLYACRAVARYNGVTNNLVWGKNVASVAKNGTGDYTFTLAAAMPNNEYAVSATGENVAIVRNLGQTATTFRMAFYTDTGALLDGFVYVSIFG